MAWVAVGTAAVGAVAGAYGSYKQSKDAKAAAKKQAAAAAAGSTPYANDVVNPAAKRYMAYQDELMADAMSRYKGDPNVYRGALDRNTADDPRSYNGGGAGGGGNDGGGGGGGNGGGGQGGPSGEDYMRRVADAGMGWGDDDLMKAGNNYVKGKLGAKDFSGDNDILQSLYLKNNGAATTDAAGMLRGFLGGGGGNGGGGNQKGMGRERTIIYQGGNGGQDNSQARIAKGGSGSGVSEEELYRGVPDSVKTDQFFGKQVTDAFGADADPANDPVLKRYTDAMTEDAARAAHRNKADVIAGVEGMGRGNSGFYASMRNAQADDDNRALLSQLSGVYLDDRKMKEASKQQMLDMVNSRDIAAMGDGTNRWIADQNTQAARANASAASAGAAESARMQERLAMRGMDLDAIGLMMGYENAGLDRQLNLGNLLSGEKQNAFSGIAQQKGIGMEGLQLAMGAGGAMSSAAAARANAASEERRYNNEMRFQREQFDFGRAQYEDQFAQDRLNMAFDNMARVGGMGGSGGGGGYVAPSINTGANTVMGALGGGMAGYGYGKQIQGDIIAYKNRNNAGA